MTTVIETRLMRAGTTNKPTIDTFIPNLVVDFDKIGKTCFSTQRWRALCETWLLSPNQTIGVTEAGGTFCAARLAYMLLKSGFSDVELVTPKIAEQHVSTTLKTFNKAMLNDVVVTGFIDKEYMLAASRDNIQIVDVRSYKRFIGEEKDPRPDVHAGHIPGAINIHYPLFLANNDESVFLSLDKIAALFEQNKIDLTKSVIFTCGSGITACIGALAAMLCGAQDVLVFDGSWAEWGSDSSLPFASGR